MEDKILETDLMQSIFDYDETAEEEVTENEQRFLAEYKSHAKRARLAITIVIVLLVAVIFVSFLLGRYPLGPADVIKIIVSKIPFVNIEQTWENVYETVVMNIRVPRILAAIAVGSSLAVSGAAYQGLFRNPMVSPDILGASSGASVGACLVMLLVTYGGAGRMLMIQGGAFVFGIAAVALSYFLSKAIGKGSNMTLLLVLCGMAVNTLFSAIVSIIKYLADTESQLPEITYWLMGSIAKVSYDDLLLFLIPFLVGLIPLMAIRWKLNILSFGEDEAKAMGVNVSRIRFTAIICSTLLTAGVVSIAGTIGWVGLMIPHLVRFIVGPNNKILIPMSLFSGAVFMLVIDNMCRCLLAYEIPLGVLTSLLGAPFFFIILFKTRGKA